jgi:hypothetical protein
MYVINHHLSDAQPLSKGLLIREELICNPSFKSEKESLTKVHTCMVL